VPRGIELSLENGQLRVQRSDDRRQSRALHGLTRTLVSNMVLGVTQGFKKGLEIVGVGYRAEVQGRTLNLNLGYSHPIQYPIPEGITITVDRNVIITVEGTDKQKVGQVAAEIRAFRRPEPYKGKGIKYAEEKIRKKVGKGSAGGR
ncbi:MAG: 50S ribosomal protein L6, partial [Thermodesulfobacteriota bacterium]